MTEQMIEGMLMSMLGVEYSEKNELEFIKKAYNTKIDADLQQDYKKRLQIMSRGGNIEALTFWFDICYPNDPSMREIVSILLQYSKIPYCECMGRLAKAYFVGAGIPQNVDKSLNLYRHLHQEGFEEFDYDYLDCLWELNSFETISELVGVFLPIAELKKDTVISLRLGQAYASGLTGKQEYLQAIRWYHVASKRGSLRAKELLFDILLGTEGFIELKKEVVAEILILADQEKSNFMMRAGKALLAGMGIKKNIVLGISYLENATNKDENNIEELLNAYIAIGTKKYLKKAVQLCQQNLTNNECWNYLVRLYAKNNENFTNWKYARYLLGFQTELFNNIHQAFRVNPKLLLKDRIVLSGTVDEIKKLFTICLQNSVPVDGYVSTEQLSPLFGDKLEILSENDAIITLGKNSNHNVNTYAIFPSKYQTMKFFVPNNSPVNYVMGDELDLKAFDNIYGNTNAVKILHSSDRYSIEQMPNNCRISTLSLNLRNIVLTRADLGTEGRFVKYSLNEIEYYYLVGASIVRNLQKKDYYLSCYGAIGDQIRCLLPKNKCDLNKINLIVNKKGQILTKFGIDCVVLEESDRYCVKQYSVMDSRSRSNIVGIRPFFPGLCPDSNEISIYSGKMCGKTPFYGQVPSEGKTRLKMSLSNANNTKKNAVLINPYGNDFRKHPPAIQRANIKVFELVTESLVKDGYVVYTNISNDKQNVLPGTLYYNASLEQYCDEARSFIAVICTFTGFMELSMHTCCNLLVVSPPRAYSLFEYANECGMSNYWEFKLNEKNVKGIASQILEVINNLSPQSYEEDLQKSNGNAINFDTIKAKLESVPDECINSVNYDVYRGRIISGVSDYNKLVETCTSVETILSKLVLSKVYQRLGQIDKAYGLMSQLSKRKAIYACELFDISWMISEDRLKEAIVDVMKFVNKGDCHSMSRLGKAYYLGRGTQSDIDKAISLLTCAHENGCTENDVELIEALWKKCTPETISQLLSISEPMALNGNTNAAIRTAQVYHYGKGINKDDEKSLLYLEKAIQLGSSWAKDLKNEWFPKL